MDHLYCMIRYRPDFVTDDQIAIGFVVGDEDNHWLAGWAPERARMLGSSIAKDLSSWIADKFGDKMSVLKLIKIHEMVETPFYVTTPRLIVSSSLQEAYNLLEKKLFGEDHASST